MSTYSLSHLPDVTLLRNLTALVARDRATTAAMLAHLAEVDARKLYLPAAYPSMYAYCVGELRLSEDAACLRIHAARTARRFPSLFPALADGRLHLSAVILLAPYLTRENADELIAAATFRSKAEIEQVLAVRFPRSELLPMVIGLAAAQRPSDQPAPGQVGVSVPERIEAAGSPAPGLIDQLSPGTVAPAPLGAGPATRPRVTPLAPERFALQVTIGQETHDKLRYAQALLGHQVPSGEIAQVLDRALDALIRQLERRKFAACRRPRRGPRRESKNPRHIPAEIKRAVWERDGGQCTFVSDSGRRCPARTRLEFDHVDPVARGGQATVSGIRLRCRAHNQYAAEQVFGAGFMHEKRDAARRAAAEKREAARRAGPEKRAQAQPAACATEPDVVPWLRALGFTKDEARRGAVSCAGVSCASLEERVRTALSALAPRCRRAGHIASAT